MSNSDTPKKPAQPIADVATSAAVEIRNAVRDTARDAKVAVEEGAAKVVDAVENLGDKAHDTAQVAGKTLKSAGKKLRGIVTGTARDLKNTIIN